MRSHHGCESLWKQQTVTNRLHIFCYKEGSNKYIPSLNAVLCDNIWVSIDWLVLTLRLLLNMLFHYTGCLGFLFNGNQRRLFKWLLGIGILNVALAKSGVIFTIKRSYSCVGLVGMSAEYPVWHSYITYIYSWWLWKGIVSANSTVRHMIVSISNDKI